MTWLQLSILIGAIWAAVAYLALKLLKHLEEISARLGVLPDGERLILTLDLIYKALSKPDDHTKPGEGALSPDEIVLSFGAIPELEKKHRALKRLLDQIEG